MIHGLLLAAGAGRRMGTPKALVRTEYDEPWLVRSVDVLLGGGCPAVTVVLGAAADEAEQLLAGTPDPDGRRERVDVVRADDWAAGMAASLRAGLTRLAATDADAALVHLVDLPDVTAAVVARVAEAATGPAVLARATYGRRPGHPVLLGRDHWPAIVADASGDQGAKGYLASHATGYVECGDLASGHDVDRR